MVRKWHTGPASAFLAALVVGPAVVLAQAATPAQQPAAAQAKAAKAKPAKPAKSETAGAEAADPAAALKAIEAGVAAYQAEKFEVAVQQLSAALMGGKLPSSQMARALYYRGAAHRKLSKPAQAISDLTSALWLKGGLSEADRSDAAAQRAAAYREAGLPDQSDGSPVAAKTALAPERPAPPAEKPAPSAKPPADVQTATIAPQAPASPPPRQPQQPVLAAVPAPTASEPAAPPASSGLSGFFNGLFGNLSTSIPTPTPPTVKANAAVEPQTSAWVQSTEVRKSASPPSAKAQASQAGHPAAIVPAVAAPALAPPAAAAPAPPAQAPSAKPAARLHVQVASARSREEAQSVAARVQQQYAGDLGARQAMVDEAIIGNMGTLYRVRIGPFADANEPRALCGKLRGAGLDCMLVSQ